MYHCLVLAGDRVTLRRVEPADYPLIQGWQNDPEVFRWMDYERPFSLEDIRHAEEHAAEKDMPFIIEAEGKAVGRIGLFRIRGRIRTAALYVFIGDRTVWGHGYARDALNLLLGYAFDTLNLELVELWTLADNERAIRLYKSLGFLEDARLRNRTYHDGNIGDSLIMSITRSEFERARSSS